MKKQRTGRLALLLVILLLAGMSAFALEGDASYVSMAQSGSLSAQEGSQAVFWVEMTLSSQYDYQVQYVWHFLPASLGEGGEYTLEDGAGISGSATSRLQVRASALTEGDYYCSVYLQAKTPGVSLEEELYLSDPVTLTVPGRQPLLPGKPDAQPPGTPNPRVVAGTDSISVDWLQVEDGGSTVLAYYCRLDEELPRMIFFTPYGANLTYFRGLKPGTDYRISVWAENAVGPGKAKLVETTTYGKKEPLPLDSYPRDAILLTIGDPNLVIGGQAQPIDEQGTAPQIQGDRTLLPLRAVVEAMGGKVGWVDATRSVSLSLEGKEILMTIGSRTVTVDGREEQLDVAPILSGGRTMLPIRYVAESFGYQVDWEADTQRVILTPKTR